jgi:predicted phosphoribosyltransferase
MPFRSRVEAGERLARALSAYKGRPVAVLALPRGGVPVAARIAEALDAPLDLVIVRKIGAPFEPELAMGAIAEGAPPLTVRNEDVISMFGVDGAAFALVRDRELAEIERRRAAYLQGRARVDVAGRTAIVVDDGIATGATMRAALRAVRARAPVKLVLAAPVASARVLAELRTEADEVICLTEHLPFGAIGGAYLDFRQVTDDEVRALLAEAASRNPAPAEEGRAPRGRTPHGAPGRARP